MSLSELREGVGHTTYKVLQGKRGTIKLAYLHPCRWRRTAPPSGNQARSCSAQSDRGGSLPRMLSGEGPTRSEGDTLHLYVGEHFVVAIYRTHTRSQKILLGIINSLVALFSISLLYAQLCKEIANFDKRRLYYSQTVHFKNWIY